MKPNLKFWRRLVQVSVAIAFILLPLLNRRGWNAFRGNFLSFHATGLPLADPLAAAQVVMKSGHLPIDLLIGAGIALILALSLGTVFCSWLCPYGLLSEWLHSLGRKVWPKNPKPTPQPNHSVKFRLSFFGLGLIIFLFLTEDLWLNQLSLPGWYSRIFQLYFNQAQISWGAGFLLGMLLVECVIQKRFWCRYLCPQAVLLSLARLVNPWHLKVAYIKEKCICRHGEAPCRTSCHLDLNPKTLPHPYDLECTNCGDCVVTCKKHGQALHFKFKK
jgi:ferredoxin-type protein NapH